jgi:hypothetical protein
MVVKAFWVIYGAATEADKRPVIVDAFMRIPPEQLQAISKRYQEQNHGDSQTV